MNTLEVEKLDEFIEHLQNEELSTNTIKSYCYAVDNFFSTYDEITKENIIKWKADLSANLTPKTVNLRLCGLEKYCEYKGANYKVKRIKTQKETSVENVLTLEMFNRLISGLEKDNEIRWKCYYLLLGKTGARISEALQFKKRDLDRGYAQMWTKGKVRKILFPKSLIDDISKYFIEYKPDDYLITNKHGKKMTTRGFATNLNKHAVKYDIPLEMAHPHSFRHMFAIEFLKRNNNISLLADLLGHSSVNTTMIYLRMSQEEQTNAINNAVNW